VLLKVDFPNLMTARSCRPVDVKMHKLLEIDLVNSTIQGKIRGLRPPEVGDLSAVLRACDGMFPGKEGPEQV
jgi:hypothetical protein